MFNGSLIFERKYFNASSILFNIIYYTNLSPSVYLSHVVFQYIQGCVGNTFQLIQLPLHSLEFLLWYRNITAVFRIVTVIDFGCFNVFCLLRHQFADDQIKHVKEYTTQDQSESAVQQQVHYGMLCRDFFKIHFEKLCNLIKSEKKVELAISENLILLWSHLFAMHTGIVWGLFGYVLLN